MQNTQLEQTTLSNQFRDTVQVARLIEQSTLQDFQEWLRNRIIQTQENNRYYGASVFCYVYSKTQDIISVNQCKTRLSELKAYYQVLFQYDIEGLEDSDLTTAIQIVQRCQAYLKEIHELNVQKYSGYVTHVYEERT